MRYGMGRKDYDIAHGKQGPGSALSWEVPMIIIFLAMAVPLLAVCGVFAMLANSNQRRGQSGSPLTASSAKQGRAADPDD
jgi:hypothetical protein